MNRPFDRPNVLLLVDDDRPMVQLMSTIIDRSYGDRIELEALTDAREARQWIESHVVDILVTDLEMPGVNGLELLRCAKRKNPCTQVLFVTGHSTLSALGDALEHGATDYLLKPFDQQELIALVDDAEQRVRRWRRALAGTFLAVRPADAATAD